MVPEAEYPIGTSDLGLRGIGPNLEVIVEAAPLWLGGAAAGSPAGMAVGRHIVLNKEKENSEMERSGFSRKIGEVVCRR